MPGSSLWLVVNSDNPFNTSLKELIGSTLPSNFSSAPKNNFLPHVTVTSDIDPSKTYDKSSPQEWLDSLTLPTFVKEKDEVNIELQELEVGDAFFNKVNLRAGKDANLLKLVSKCREQAVLVSESDAQAWAEKEYQPHLSLFYGDLSNKDIKKKIPMIELQLGFEFGSLFDCCGGTLAMGARLVLVDTSKEIKDWSVMAERPCPWAMWKMARGLL